MLLKHFAFPTAIVTLDIKALINPALSPSCKISVNSYLNTLVQSCISPYDYDNLERQNYIESVKSPLFLPTFCDLRCRNALEQFEKVIAGGCDGQSIVSDAVGDYLSDYFKAEFGSLVAENGGGNTSTMSSSTQSSITTTVSPNQPAPKVVTASQPAPEMPAAPKVAIQPTTITLQTAPAQPQPQASLPTQVNNFNNRKDLIKRQSSDPVKEYFKSLAPTQFAFVLNNLRSIMCTPESETKVNPMENQYCIKSQLEPYNFSLNAFILGIQKEVKQNNTNLYCNDCLRNQFARGLKFVKEIKVFGSRVEGVVQEIDGAISKCNGIKALLSEEKATGSGYSGMINGFTAVLAATLMILI